MSSPSVESRIGPFRAPRNMASHQAGSIHDDATASKLGFKGGTVAGSVHMDQFAPMLVDVYGERWFETGDISLFFTQATVDGEKVRCEVDPGAERAALRMYNEAGELICEGTASLDGPDPDSELTRRQALQKPAAPGALRILGDLKVGDENPDLPLSLPRDVLDRALETITETLPAYAERGVLPPSHAVRLSHIARSAVLKKAHPAVGLFGALQVQHLNGPLLAGADYIGRTRVLKLTESPRTENVWYEVVAADPVSGQDVASVLYCLRFMKGSSPLWSDTAA